MRGGVDKYERIPKSMDQIKTMDCNRKNQLWQNSVIRQNDETGIRNGFRQNDGTGIRNG